METAPIKRYALGNEVCLEIYDSGNFITLVSPTENPTHQVLIPKGLLSSVAEDFVEIEATYSREIEERKKR